MAQTQLVRRRNEDWDTWAARLVLALSQPPSVDAAAALRQMASQYTRVWGSASNAGYELYSFYRWLGHHICDTAWPALVLTLVREWGENADQLSPNAHHNNNLLAQRTQSGG